jgi:acetyl-CoA synthetase
MADFLSTKLPELASFPEEINSYESLYKFSIEQSDLFWSTLAKTRLDWMQPFDQVCSSTDFATDDSQPFHLKWFLNGKLNVSGESH